MLPPTGPDDRAGDDAGAAPGPPELLCSSRGCRAGAGWGLLWNNPRLHDPERRKTWLACDDHRERLATHLDVRGFLRDVVPAERLTGGRS